ncbi:alpha/beta hydrolase family esterase [Aeromicrobium piscarium]|uniref:Polyhydroxybutyrate depolymerase n=1 Tax=Aeromicrobium piscarium TaxID=2590901 RepID=A0A554SPY0_9ACTN|nr:PHB depolymerase family esterase [Aeromicrobium piscarium]TSD68378.1 hypothetical protein FNM00_01950 [Aeromicrobium piscarium]
MLRRIIVLLVLCASMVACAREPAPAPPPPPAPTWNAGPEGACEVPETGASAHTLDIDGEKRRFAVDVPDGFNGERLPVVFVTHGRGGEATAAMAYTGFPEYGQQYGFIVVAPQAEGRPALWDFSTGPEVAGSDFAFIAALREHVVESWCGDDEQVFMTGFSNGSAMTFAAACLPSLRFKAFGAVAAPGYVPERCDSAPPASIIYAHGTADPVVPFVGGETVIQWVEPATQVMNAWALHDGCAHVEREQIAEDVQVTRWDVCRDESRLVFYVIDGEGHHWPGGPSLPGLGASTRSINITALMTEFFGLSD